MRKGVHSPAPVSPALLFSIIDSASDVVIVADQKRRIVYANRAACAKTGFSGPELLGMNIMALYPKGSRAKYTSQILGGIHKCGKWSGEAEVRKKDGTTFWADTQVYAWRDDSGKVAGTIGIGRDLSDRRLLGQQQWESNAHMRMVFESMGDAVWVCDARGQILVCNEAHCRMLGQNREEIVGALPPYPWVEAADRRRLRDGFRILVKEGKLKNYAMKWRRCDGSALIVSLAFWPIKDRAGAPAGWACTARDITDVQYVEELRRANDRMQRLVTDIRRKAERLQILEEINTLLLKNADAGRTFRSVVGGLRKLVQHDLACIYVCDGDLKSLVPHTLSKHTPFSRKLAGFPLRLGEGVIGAAALSGKTMLVNDAHLDPRSRYPSLLRPESEHIVASPLRDRGLIFGVLVVARNGGPQFLEEEVAIIKSFASAATVAIEHSFLSPDGGGNVIWRRPEQGAPPLAGIAPGQWTTAGKIFVPLKKRGPLAHTIAPVSR